MFDISVSRVLSFFLSSLLLPASVQARFQSWETFVLSTCLPPSQSQRELGRRRRRKRQRKWSNQELAPEKEGNGLIFFISSFPLSKRDLYLHVIFLSDSKNFFFPLVVFPLTMTIENQWWWWGDCVCMLVRTYVRERERERKEGGGDERKR